jgi:hypothetical protein
MKELYQGNTILCLIQLRQLCVGRIKIFHGIKSFEMKLVKIFSNFPLLSNWFLHASSFHCWLLRLRNTNNGCTIYRISQFGGGYSSSFRVVTTLRGSMLAGTKVFFLSSVTSNGSGADTTFSSTGEGAKLTFFSPCRAEIKYEWSYSSCTMTPSRQLYLFPSV